MNIRIFEDTPTLAREAADHAFRLVDAAIQGNGKARILVATGASQAELIGLFAACPLDWNRVEMFHLDEYVGLAPGHSASFQKYLMDRFIHRTGIACYHLLDGTHPVESCRETGRAIASAPIDLAFAGIGENGHLAFNDPPADFEAETPFRIVDLDEACRRQQVSEGWFAHLDEVPKQAISISICQLLKSRAIISVVPDMRKAQAVRRCLEGPVGPLAPASALRNHPDATVYLDRPSASLLRPDTLRLQAIFKA